MAWNIRKNTTIAIPWLGLVLRMSAARKMKRLRVRYKSLGLPGSYAGADTLSKALGGQSVKEALMGEDSYTLHRPVLYRFPRRKTIVSGPMDQFQCDLVDCSVYKNHNDGIRYLFCCIDVFTKQAWVHPLRSKRGQETAQAMESILKALPRMPLSLQSECTEEIQNSLLYHRKRDNESSSSWEISKNATNHDSPLYDSHKIPAICRCATLANENL